MAKKIIDTTKIANELEGASLFFNKPVNPTPQPPTMPVEPRGLPRVKESLDEKNRKQAQTVIPRHHDTMVSRYHDTTIENIRRAVKQFGKEAATHRFTMEEKDGVREIIFTYRSQGVATSENEISRIAVNFIMEDFKENGEESVLARVLKKLKE